MFRPGEHALIVDDVLTTGGSLVKAAEAAREQHLTVTHGLVVVDRSEQEGKTHLSQQNIRLLSILTLQDLMQKH